MREERISPTQQIKPKSRDQRDTFLVKQTCLQTRSLTTHLPLEFIHLLVPHIPSFYVKNTQNKDLNWNWTQNST